MEIVDDIKAKLPIAELIGKAFEVTGRGRVLSTREHDSLRIWPATGTWRWFSRGIGGDAFDWWELQHSCDFAQALRDLAALAGVELRPPTPEQQRAYDEQRGRLRIFGMAAEYCHLCLMEHPAAAGARYYCHARGWTDETLRAMRLGYTLPAHAEADGSLSVMLRSAGLLDQPAARAVLSLPQDHLVYPHLVGAQVTYLSARSVSGKRHFNLPTDTAGPRQVFVAEPVVTTVTPGATVLVEGQADAISLAQLGFHAIALCGVETKRAQPDVSHVALDNDEAGLKAGCDLAAAIGPLVRVVTWPAAWPPAGNGQPVKDANDLLRAGVTSANVADLLEQAPAAIFALAGQARQKRGGQRKELIRRICRALGELDDVTATDIKPEVARWMGENLGQLNRLLKAAGKQKGDDGGDEGEGKDGEREGARPERYDYSAGGFRNGILFEECVEWSDSGVNVFYIARLRDGTVKKLTSVDAGEISYVPYPATMDLITKKVVLFPSGQAEYGTQRELLRDIRAFIHRWLDVDPFYEQLASYYVMFSWLYDLFETLPYLRALGDYGTGKSRFIQTIGALCYRPMFISGASTASPVFRVIDMFKGTLVVDEADLANSDAEAEIIKIFNVGYSKGGVVLRAEKDENTDNYWPSAKEVYGPKVLATRRLFQDRATESRCLTKRMTTSKPRPEIRRVIGPEFWDAALELRNRLLGYRLRNYRQIDINHALSDASIEPRLDQVTLALKTLVDDEDMREQINQFVRAYNETLISDRGMSLSAMVVGVLAETWFRPTITLTGPERDWTMKGIAERVQLVINDLDPELKMSPRKLTQVLSEDLGLTGRDKKQEGRSHRTTLVIEEAELRSLMSRYGVAVPEE